MVEVLAAAAAAFLVGRLITYLNRWEFLPFEFTDPALVVIQVATVILVLVGYWDVTFAGAVIAMALADIATAVTALVDAAIVRARVGPPQPPQARRQPPGAPRP